MPLCCVCLFCIGWLGYVQIFITRAEPLYDSLNPLFCDVFAAVVVCARSLLSWGRFLKGGITLFQGCTYAKQTSTPRGHYFYKKLLHEFVCSSIYRHISRKVLKCFFYRMRVILAWDVQLAVIAAKRLNYSALRRKLGICINPVKEDNLLRYTHIFENFFLEISVPFVPVSKIFKFLVEW